MIAMTVQGVIVRLTKDRLT